MSMNLNRARSVLTSLSWVFCAVGLEVFLASSLACCFLSGCGSEKPMDSSIVEKQSNNYDYTHTDEAVENIIKELERKTEPSVVPEDENPSPTPAPSQSPESVSINPSPTPEEAPGPASSPAPSLLPPLPPSPKNYLVLVATNFKTDDGWALFAVFKNKNDFDNKLPTKGGETQIRQGKAIVVFSEIPWGVYGVSFFHDKNQNYILDLNFLGIPKEGFGFSNNAMGTFGPPDFEDISFEFKTAKKIIEMKTRHF